MGWLINLLRRPEPEPEPELDQYSRFWRDHVLLWIGIWQQTDTPSLDAVKDIEDAIRAWPEFHELESTGDENDVSPRLSVWLRRDTPGDADGQYIDRAADRLNANPDPRVGWEVGLGDY